MYSLSTTLDCKAINYTQQVLNETQEAKEQGLEALRKWLTINAHLHAKSDDYNLIRFLRATKFNYEQAQKKISNFYILRGTAPEWFHNRNPNLPEIQKLLEIGVFLPLLERDDKGRMIIFIRVAAHNPYLHKQDDVFKVGMMTLDLALDKMEDVSVYGVVAIFDMDGVSYGHARQLTTSMIRKAVHSWQDCYPVRVKGLHFINSPVYINVVLNIFRRFMRQKMRSRVHVHGYDRKSLHNIVPKELLPEEYGGSNGKLQHLIDFWKKEVSSSTAWYEQDETYKYLKS
ncbi:retinol-binding protein pinta-like isoform X2 [Rhodnius prolixus]|uniref:Putative phosphatidylinositol transfer protein sec14 n=2 Tax=Rhodnius TaxID=13248 RepID=R4G7S7_RHOPR